MARIDHETRNRSAKATTGVPEELTPTQRVRAAVLDAHPDASPEEVEEMVRKVVERGRQQHQGTVAPKPKFVSTLIRDRNTPEGKAKRKQQRQRRRAYR